MSWTPPDFATAKARFLRIAAAVEKADNAPTLRALLMADLEAPYHSFNPLTMVSRAENTVMQLVDSMLDDLDEDGVPK